MMGLFNWGMKATTMDRRNRSAQAITDNPVALQNTETEIEQTHVPSAQEQASAVLFNYSPQPQTQSYTSAPSYNSYDPNASQFQSTFAGNTLGNRHIMVLTPRNDNEVIGIVEHLKTNEAVIVNFEGIPTAETQRRIDFLSGVACGLGGTIKSLDNHKYIITPSGIGVR